MAAPNASDDGTGSPRQPAGPAQRSFGLRVATALIIGTIIGVGVFNLPTALATYGPIGLVSMGLTTIGALALALLFAALSRRLPADGGPYAYARTAYGNTLGFFSAWSYWITAWAGNAAIAVGWVLYVEVFLNQGHNRFFSVLLVLAALWLSALVNLVGVRQMGLVQVVTTVLKFAALAFMATVGLFFVDGANYSPANISGEGTVAAIGGGMAIGLFSYLGVETVAVAAGKVRDPDRNIPRSTVIGTLATAAVYMLSLVAVFGILPAARLKDSTAPFSDAANVIFGGTWAGNAMAVAVIISGLGALNGWTMICAEMPLAAAHDGLLPARFKQLSAKGVPAFGVVASTVLASVAVIVNYSGSGGTSVFTTLVLMTGITAAIPYALSAGAQIKWRLADRRHAQRARFARDMVIAVLSLAFSLLFIWYSRDTSRTSWGYWAPFLLAAAALLCGVPVHRAQRRHMTPPTEVPPWR
ncbi:APC family permease [Streptomyces sp. M-16]|uniref:APC family permease n=1 Tax=Streptomyces sp. M-16 TaxID=3233040 RepID=UPI003F9CE86E